MSDIGKAESYISKIGEAVDKTLARKEILGDDTRNLFEAVLEATYAATECKLWKDTDLGTIIGIPLPKDERAYPYGGHVSFITLGASQGRFKAMYLINRGITDPKIGAAYTVEGVVAPNGQHVIDNVTAAFPELSKMQATTAIGMFGLAMTARIK